jgi:flagellar assembly protein FliH
MSRILGRPDAAGHSALPKHLRAGYRSDEIGAARAQAAQALLAARTQARAIAEAAEATAQARVAEAMRAGWDQGYAAGLEQAQQAQAATTARLAALIHGAAVAQEESLRNLDEAVVALALALTRQIVQHEVQIAPETILQVARAALRELSAEAEVVIRAHPGDVALLESRRHQLDLPASVSVSVVADTDVAPGGCLIESGVGRVDATIDTQLERIGALLHEQLGAAQP